ncbi:MAG: hypothetical protein OK439_00615 [Thaumarchaeota archaeon]|nr:hypothetical protein [Nitrososphaerota archaeon]
MAGSTVAERRETLNFLESSLPADIHGLDVQRITELLQGYGFVCKVHGKLRGISGNLHEFDFVCTKTDTGDKMIIESLLTLPGDQEAMEIEIVKLRLKTYDCTPDVCIVIAAPSAFSVREMASLYRLSLLEAVKEKSPYDQLETLLRLREGDPQAPRQNID